MKFIFMSLLMVSMSFAADKIIASCSNAKSELFDLGKETSTGYNKDSMTMNLIFRNEKVYAKSNSSESKLVYLGGKNPQFLEEVASGHNVLYTYFKKQKILTIQKSYDFLGAIMVNIHLKCK
ncbi:MAG: hypothetical protein GQ474_07440 [Sulfurimonas sp.]|nr:hypothetical protein [Sulfurimonas sp.]